MSKIKTKSGAKKRFKVTGSGKIKHKRAYMRHILTKKKTDRKRRLSGMKLVDKTDLNNIRPMIPYAL